MNIQPDFEDFLRLLEAHRVDYMIVDGYAVAFHGFPRFTKDLDIFFDSVTENVERLRRALIEFGFRDDSVQPTQRRQSLTGSELRGGAQ